jgi:DNA-binding NarL/FixJ family response regulator
MPFSETARKVGVLTVDDQSVFRKAATAVVDATPGFEAIGEAASGEEALRLSSLLRPALVLLDVRMPGMDGIETARKLAVAHPEAVVVLISIEDISDGAPLVERSGAATLLAKQSLCPRVLEQLWHAHRPR